MLTKRKTPFTSQPFPSRDVLRFIRLVRTVLPQKFSENLTYIAYRSRLLTDPTSFEEPLLATTITVVVDEQNQLISVAQYGPGSAPQQDILLKCIAAAKQRRKEIGRTLSNL